MDEMYELLAIRYATNPFTSNQTFIGSDPHDRPTPLDYFIWIARNVHRTVVIDTGFGPEAAARRQRRIELPVKECLQAAGVDRHSVTDVIITHLHYDHAGNNNLFPKAQFHLQEAEMAFATGPCMCHLHCNHPYEVGDVVSMVRRIYAGNVSFCRGDAQLFPGLTVHHIGGHSRGLQCVRIMTRRGVVVLASDAAHFYEHITAGKVFPVCDSVSDTLAGYDRLIDLAGGLDRVVPGHDPLVVTLFPPFSEKTKGRVLRLDTGWVSDPGFPLQRTRPNHL